MAVKTRASSPSTPSLSPKTPDTRLAGHPQTGDGACKVEALKHDIARCIEPERRIAAGVKNGDPVVIPVEQEIPWPENHLSQHSRC